MIEILDIHYPIITYPYVLLAVLLAKWLTVACPFCCADTYTLSILNGAMYVIFICADGIAGLV
jgi:hypothetical protein